MRARRLRPGERIAVVAASGPVRRAPIRAGIGFLEALGHPVIAGPSLMKRRGFLAGEDELRAADLNAAIRRADIPAIFFARGGWGMARILDRVDLPRLHARNRVLLGYSDPTSLFMALQRPRRGYPYRYGPSVAELGDPRAYHRGTLDEALRLPADRIEHDLRGCRVLRHGAAEGLVLGGCLTLLAGAMGTRYDMPWDGCILFWEEVNEEPFRLDRLLNQLRLAGKLRSLAGMIVGRLAGCGPRPGTPGLPIREILLDATAGTRYPIVTGFPAGHVPRKRTLLLGVPGRLETRRTTLTLFPGG